MIRDAGDGTVLVTGASETAVDSAEALAELLQRGTAARCVAGCICGFPW